MALNFKDLREAKIEFSTEIKLFSPEHLPKKVIKAVSSLNAFKLTVVPMSKVMFRHEPNSSPSLLDLIISSDGKKRLDVSVSPSGKIFGWTRRVKDGNAWNIVKLWSIDMSDAKKKMQDGYFPHEVNESYQLNEAAFSGEVWHGSNARFPKFEQSKARILNDLWGGGVAYFTDDKSTGKNYAKGMAKKSGEPLLYHVKLSLKKVFDVDDTFTGSELTKFFDKKTLDDFARGAGLLKIGSDKYKTLISLEKGTETLTGEQVFNGLSRGGVNTANARKKLMQLGYDGIRYNGGVMMGMKRHSVYMPYYDKSIKIIKRYKVLK